MPKKKEEEIVQFFAILGGIVGLIEAILYLAGRRLYYLPSVGPIGAYICILFAIIVLVSSIQPGKVLPFNWIIFAICGVVLLICGSIFGGILTLLAGILLFVYTK